MAGSAAGGLANRAPGLPAGRGLRLLAECANPACASGWLQLWRRRSVPVFEAGWCCSPGCMRARVEAALRRESEARGAALERHRHRMPLGLAMLEQGWITAADLRRALGAQRAAGTGRLGQWLVQGRATTEAMVTRALGLQWNCPVLSVDLGGPEALTAALPRLFVDAFGALPLRVAAGKILYLGFEDRLDPALALALERMLGLRVESGLVAESRFRPAQQRMLEARFPPVELIEAASLAVLARVLTRAIERAHAAEARLVRLHDFFWLRLWRSEPAGGLAEPDQVSDLICTLAASGSGDLASDSSNLLAAPAVRLLHGFFAFEGVDRWTAATTRR